MVIHCVKQLTTAQYCTVSEVKIKEHIADYEASISNVKIQHSGFTSHFIFHFKFSVIIKQRFKIVANIKRCSHKSHVCCTQSTDISEVEIDIMSASYTHKASEFNSIYSTACLKNVCQPSYIACQNQYSSHWLTLAYSKIF